MYGAVDLLHDGILQRRLAVVCLITELGGKCFTDSFLSLHKHGISVTDAGTACFPDNEVISLIFRTAFHEAVAIRHQATVPCKVGIHNIRRIFHQMFNQDSSIAFAGAVCTFYPKRAAAVRFLFVEGLTQHLHHLFHVFTDNVLTPQVFITSISVNVNDRFECWADFNKIRVLLVRHDCYLLIYSFSARSRMSILV